MLTQPGGHGDAEQHPGDASRVCVLQPRCAGRSGRHGKCAQVSSGEPRCPGLWGPVHFHPLSRNMGGDSDMEAQIILSDVVCDIFNDWGSGDFCLRGGNQSMYTVQQCGKI